MLNTAQRSGHKPRLALITAAAALLAGSLFAGGPTQAAEREPAPSASGSAIAPDNSDYTIGSTAPGGGITPMAVRDVGGGTWNYGSFLGFWPPKTCYSNYIHNSKYHSSTAIISASNVKRYATAGNWSNANTYAGAIYTCYTYWATY